MDPEEYQNIVSKEDHKFEKSIIRTFKISLLGIGLACSLLAYDSICLFNYINKLKKDPVMNEIYLAVKENDIQKANELEGKTIEVKKYVPGLKNRIKKGRAIHNAAVGIMGLSTLYLFGASGINVLIANKKRKSLEKQLTENSSE